MLVGCPKCKTRFRLDDSKVKAEGSILRCSRCRTLFRVSGVGRIADPSPADASRTRRERPLMVLVANESLDFCREVEQSLSSEPFTVFSFQDGHETLAAIEERIPDAVLLDVALPGMYGFEICERMRANPSLASVKTILVASIYDKTRYKREPQSLYGADDYIEKHHIPDSLAAKIYSLVFGQDALEQPDDQPASVSGERETDPRELSPGELEEQEAMRERIRSDEEAKTCAALAPKVLEAHERARRLARIIVSDIVLYNQKKVEEGVREGTFRDVLREEISEGFSLYERRVPEEVRADTSYLEDAIAAFLERERAGKSAADETR